MDKNAIKKYAVWARKELIERVSQKALLYGITAKDCGDPAADAVNGRLLSPIEKKQRLALIAYVKSRGYEQVIEEAAYTWFNRFAALRFMEVNGYLPSRVRVFTDSTGSFGPEILQEAINLDLPGIDMGKVYELEDASRTEELFKYLLVVQCNALNSILPKMFQKIEDYTELLLPDNLLHTGSVIERLVTDIPEEDWKNQVQIIGWLYQYYNTEPKDKVYADLKKNIKVSKENIPAATQLFTPDWIVHYMVENSLGRLWLEGHPNEVLKAGWKYYVEEAEQEPEVEAQLKVLRRERAGLKPGDIRCIDPCSGSGHILCVFFDVLVQIYKAYGYTEREAAVSIVKNNLWGLDIDDRAAQLSYFAVMMKARQYDRRFFARNIQPQVYAIAESNQIDSQVVEYYCKGDARLRKAIETIIKELHDAKEYGSILNVSEQDWNALYARFAELKDEASMYKEGLLKLLELVLVARVLSQKYDVVVTNPPYMGYANMNPKLNKFTKDNYPDSKADLYAVCIERCNQFTKNYSYQAMITMHSWMFLSSFEKLRKKILRKVIVNMTHLGARAFEEIGGEVVQATSFIVQKKYIQRYKGKYYRLSEPNTQQGKENMFLARENIYIVKQDDYSKIPGSPLAYWVNKKFYDCFNRGISIDAISDYTGNQHITGNNEKYLRFHWEVGRTPKWKTYSKGGEYRKWYGNIIHIIDWGYKAINFYKNNYSSTLLNKKYIDKEGIVYTKVSSKGTGFRYFEGGVFDKGGPEICNITLLNYTIGLLNSSVFNYYIDLVNPTINLQVRDIKGFPIIIDRQNLEAVESLAKSNIAISRTDWDSFETSWDFKRHPLLDGTKFLVDAYKAWQKECDNYFAVLKHNEEELNRIFINLYGLQDELVPEESDKDVTVHRLFNSKEDILDSMQDSDYALTKEDVVKSLISYAVGCMFGRYSLDVPGLAYAGGTWAVSKYISFLPDDDGIIPICDDEYFTDDIVGRFVQFLEVAYGKDTLEENLNFIASALGGTGSSRQIIRSYFLNDFYKDHCRTYKKRPIYWLFDSGKKNGFKCLIYLHRYQPDMIARIRTDYVHEQQSRYRTAIAALEGRLNSDSLTASDRVKLNKQLTKLKAQSTEIHDYEEKIHHLADQYIAIDLDDGVKVNYAKFQDVLAKIK